MLVHVLCKNQVEARATNDFTVFVITNRIDNVRLLLTMLEDDFKLMGYDIDFNTFCALQVLNKMYNEQILDKTSKDNKNMWFLNLGKCIIMRHMTRETKMTTIPFVKSVTASSVPLGQLNSNKAKLETAWQSSLVMCNTGKPLLAPMPMASNVSCWVTFGPTTAATIPPVTVAAPTPTMATLAVTMTTAPVAAPLAAPTMTCVMSCAAEFDKGG